MYCRAMYRPSSADPGVNPHPPPHLVEVCALLARGLLRLRSRTADEIAADAAATEGRGEFRLHFLSHQRGHATRTKRRDA